MTSSLTILLSALALGVYLGAVLQRSRFCTLGAVVDLVVMHDHQRMRMWCLAILFATLATQALDALAIIRLQDSIYTASTLTWLSHLLGGGCLGVGMALAAGCPTRQLVLLASGQLRAVVVLFVMLVVALMTLRGVLAELRVHVLNDWVVVLTPNSTLDQWLAHATGYTVTLSKALVLIAFSLILGGYIFWRCALSSRTVWGGLAVGAGVVIGWLISGYWGYVAEHPETLEAAYLATSSRRMESVSILGSGAYLLEWLIYWTDSSRVLTFGMTLILGLVLGAGGSAWQTKRFAWVGLTMSVRETCKLLGGAALMGFGGVVALGCTFGQGITGISTLSIGAVLSLVGIMVGARWALRWA